MNEIEFTPAEESYFFSKNMIQSKVRDFETGKSNVLLITGLSGSGKTTLANDYQKKYNATIINLDDLDYCTRIEDKNSPIYFYLHNVPSGIQFYKGYISKTLTQEKYNSLIKIFGHWLFAWCESHKETNFIIEGIHIYLYFNIDDVKKYPIIITGTSMLKSLIRREKREGIESEFIQLCRYYIDSEKSLKSFEKDLLSDVMESVDDPELLKEFLMIDDIDKVNEYKKIPIGEVSKLIHYESGFRFCHAITDYEIPSGVILEEKAIVIPLGEAPKFKNLKFSNLASAIFGTPENKNADVKFDYHYDNGMYYWDIVTIRDIPKNHKLSYEVSSANFTFDEWQ